MNKKRKKQKRKFARKEKRPVLYPSCICIKSKYICYKRAESYLVIIHQCINPRKTVLEISVWHSFWELLATIQPFQQCIQCIQLALSAHSLEQVMKRIYVMKGRLSMTAIAAPVSKRLKEGAKDFAIIKLGFRNIPMPPNTHSPSMHVSVFPYT